MTSALGVSIPLDGVPLGDHRVLLGRLVDAGCSDVSTGETNRYDGITPLGLVAGWCEQVTVSCFVTNAFVRGPGLLASTAAALAAAAPGRARFGIGASSPVIVEDWNGAVFERPYTRISETLKFLRAAFAGATSSGDTVSFRSTGFRLVGPLPEPPRLVIAALGPRMQALAAARADGVALNFVTPTDVEVIRAGHAEVERELDDPLEIITRIFLVPIAGEAGERAARQFLAAYMRVPIYAELQRRLGRGEALATTFEALGDRDWSRAAAAIPEDVLRGLVVWGTTKECSDQVAAFMRAGSDLVTVWIVRPVDDGVADGDVDFLCDVSRTLDRMGMLRPAGLPESATGMPPEALPLEI
jgi:probable F420-dependent oxidoreductase